MLLLTRAYLNQGQVLQPPWLLRSLNEDYCQPKPNQKLQPRAGRRKEGSKE